MVYLNREEPEKILRIYQNVFQRIRSTASQIVTTRRIIEIVREHISRGNIIICRLIRGI